MSTHVANREWSGIARREVLVTIVKAFAGSTQAVRRMCPTRADSDMISYRGRGRLMRTGYGRHGSQTYKPPLI